MINSASELTPIVMLVGPDAEAIKQALLLQVAAASQWRVLVCADASEATQIPATHTPSLVVLPDQTLSDQGGALFGHAKQAWPETSFLVATRQAPTAFGALLGRYGDMAFVEPDPAPLCAAIEREVNGLSYGSLRGLSLSGLLQMMEWEAKSLSIRVQAGHDWGRLHLRHGHLVDAYTHARRRTGEAAALDILAWDGVSLTLERSYHNAGSGTLRPLASLLMEAMRRKDERARDGLAADGADFNPSDLVSDDREDDMLHKKGRRARGTWSGPSPAALTQTQATQREPSSQTLKEINMAQVKETLDSTLHSIDGAMAAALVDYTSGMALGMAGSGVNLEMAAAGNTEVVRAKLRTMDTLGIKGSIEDILITLDAQYHIIYLVPGQTLFLYLVLDKAKSNLAMARYKLKALGADIKI